MDSELAGDACAADAAALAICRDAGEAGATVADAAAELVGTGDAAGEEDAAADTDAAAPVETEYAAEIAKTYKGFGIYFTRRARDGQDDALAVDGFVEGVREEREGGADADAADGLARLQVGDVLTHINDVDCSKLEMDEVLALLRSAPVGTNTLRFRRPAAEAQREEEEAPDRTEQQDKDAGAGSLAGSLIGALRKVKSRLKAEMDEEARREQEAHERFEKQWLAEFDRFKAAHAQRWETCSYSADEFCGHMYRGSDAQQRAYLEHEYPTLMEAWKESGDLPNALPQWPPAKTSLATRIQYSEPGELRAGCLACDVECAAALREALEFLRREFMWRSSHVDAFGRRLEALGISSCAELAAAMDAGARSCLFERRLQVAAFPRLTKPLCRALRARAEQTAAARSEAASDQLGLVLG